MNIGEIRTALATTVQDGCGFQVYERAVLNPDPPCGVIVPAPFGGDEVYDGESDLRLILLLMASSVDYVGGQDLLDQWISTEGTKSIKVQLDESLGLGGIVESVKWSGISEYGPMQLSDGGTVYLAARCLIDVLVH